MINKKTKTTKKKNTGTKGKRILAIFLTAILLTGILTVGLLAKYRSHNQKQAELISSQFHVSSDYLAENNPSYEITDWQGGFDIQLYNYEKENTALIADDEITYSVVLSDTAKWTYSDEHEGTMEKSNVKQSQSIKINPQSTASENDSVTVTVNITAPFKKDLSATFTMHGKDQVDYNVQDRKDGTVLLTIQSNGYSGKINIKWDTGKYAPDNTNSQMTSWTDGSEELTVQKNTIYELLFFKKTVESITTTFGSGTTISLS